MAYSGNICVTNKYRWKPSSSFVFHFKKSCHDNDVIALLSKRNIEISFGVSVWGPNLLLYVFSKNGLQFWKTAPVGKMVDNDVQISIH